MKIGTLIISLLVFTGLVSAVTLEDVEITVDPLDRVSQSFHGYVEYRVRLSNLSSAQDRRIDLQFPRHSWRSDSSIKSIRKTVFLPSNSEVVVSLMQPPLKIYGSNQLGIRINGEETGLNMTVQNHGLVEGRYSSRIKPYACLLYSRGVNSDVEKRITDLYKKSSPSRTSSRRGSSSKDFEIKRSDLDLDQWSTRWLGYSSYDAIFVTSREFDTAPNRVLEALKRYVECGGTLVVVGSWQAPVHWQANKAKHYDMDCYYVGLGVCFHHVDEDVTGWTGEAWKEMQRTWQSGLQGQTAVRSPERAHEMFPVIENITVPARTIFLLMLVFALLIGPLNLLYFSKKGYRMRLFWTVPLVSLVTSGIVFGCAMVSEGVTGKVRVAGITWLDQRTHHAVTLGCLGYYCPLTPGGGVSFDQETEVTPQVARANWREQGRVFTMTWSDRQELDGGWVTARVPSHLMIRRHETRRERVVVRKDQDGKVYATNGLGTDIKQLWLADADGQLYQIKNLVDGRSEALTPYVTQGELAEPGYLHQLFNGTWLRWFETISETPTRVLRPGSYVALLEEQPFMERGRDRFRVINTEALVIGILD